MNIKTYNPLDKMNLGASVADAMIESDVLPLGRLQSFDGAGIYAIYYVGDFEAYKPLAEKNKNHIYSAPIYVGKAIPPGARKGNLGLNSDPGFALYKRLQEHAESVNAVGNLNIEDFFCRFLVVDDIWIPLGESLLIAQFRPIWNTLIDGFGNHDPGKGRYESARPRWDTMHPGRGWANKCTSRVEILGQIEEEIKAYFKENT